jgi:hypothetical protein
LPGRIGLFERDPKIDSTTSATIFIIIRGDDTVAEIRVFVGDHVET